MSHKDMTPIIRCIRVVVSTKTLLLLLVRTTTTTTTRTTTQVFPPVPLALLFRQLAHLEHVPPRSLPSPRLRLLPDPTARLKDLPRLLDCVYQVLWWLACVWGPQVFDGPCQSFQGSDQAHVDLWNWHDRQRGFLHEQVQVRLGLHHLLLRLLEIILGLLQRLHRLLS